MHFCGFCVKQKKRPVIQTSLYQKISNEFSNQSASWKAVFTASKLL